MDLEASSKDVWPMSCDQYMKRAVAYVELELAEVLYLRNRVSTPLPEKYRPEIDLSDLFNDNCKNHYKGLIGVLRWIAKLGRIDLLTSVAYLLHFLDAPRERHLEADFHIVAYLKKYGRKQLVFDGTYLTHYESKFSKADCSPNMPKAPGKQVLVTCYVDTDHAGCQATWRSQTGILMNIH
jgi:hypothetical protein